MAGRPLGVGNNRSNNNMGKQLILDVHEKLIVDLSVRKVA